MLKPFLIALLMCPVVAAAQSDAAIHNTRIPARHYKPVKRPVRNGFCLLPARARTVNGLSFGVWSRNSRDTTLRLNGINIDVNPLGVLLAFYVPFTAIGNVVNAPDSVTMAHTALTSNELDKSFHTIIKGIDVRAAGGIPIEELHGISINGLVSDCEIQHGATVSGVGNHTLVLDGVQVAGLCNSAIYGKGIQIGLFNQAVHCNCIQIGLLNRNGRSLQPLVNWPHRRRHKKAPPESAGV